MTITNEEYEKQFKKYLEEQGPNTGTGFFGKWGWYAKRKETFDKIFAKRQSEKVLS